MDILSNWVEMRFKPRKGGRIYRDEYNRAEGSVRVVSLLVEQPSAS
jgi:hypothetical protein